MICCFIREREGEKERRRDGETGGEIGGERHREGETI
jgi:hypothetical protein